ncbi:MAG: glutaredoxin family protein [Acidobacteria bacterium]|nr:glutaredoxin family protein [Acidobacteriota bacterium]MCA1650682.1 glutaredoxin family protein [Acidobacteriota bacterium]
MKELLSRDGHPFTARNVEEDHAAYTDLLALGFRTIPVTVIGGRAIKGFDEPALRRALVDAAGEP